MAKRFSKSALPIAALTCFALAVAIASAVYFSGPAPVLHDVASEARLPIPGTRDVDLPAGEYGLYFGDLNAPRGKVMGVPSLDVTIVPSEGIADPQFVKVPPTADVYVEGYHTVQVARITVATPGRYHVHVESREQNGGSFSIGKPPGVISPGRNVLRAWPFIALFAFMGIVVGIARRRTRSQAIRESGKGSAE